LSKLCITQPHGSRSAEDLVLPTVFQTEPLNSPTENDVQQSSCDLLDPSKLLSVSIPNLAVQMDSPKLSIIYKNDETDTIATEVKPKRRSLWKRTKRFFRHLFCFGEREVRRSSSRNLAVKTEFAVEEFDVGLTSAIQEPMLIESPLFPEDLMLPMVPMVLQIESYTDPAVIDVQQSTCVLEDPNKRLSDSMQNISAQMDSEFDSIHTSLPQEPRCDETVPVFTKAKSKRRSLWKRTKCVGRRLFLCA